MKAWWMQLATRERLLVVLGASVLAGGLMYALTWQPLARSIVRNEAHIAQQRVDLAWMLSAARQLQALRVSAAHAPPVTAAARGQPLAALLDIALRTQGLDGAIAQRSIAEDGSIRLILKPVPFDALLRCLASLQEEGVRVQALGLERAGAGQAQGSVQVARRDGS